MFPNKFEEFMLKVSHDEKKSKLLGIVTLVLQRESIDLAKWSTPYPKIGRISSGKEFCNSKHTTNLTALSQNRSI